MRSKAFGYDLDGALTYAESVARRDNIVMIVCSDPWGFIVCPHGAPPAVGNHWRVEPSGLITAWEATPRGHCCVENGQPHAPSWAERWAARLPTTLIH